MTMRAVHAAVTKYFVEMRGRLLDMPEKDAEALGDFLEEISKPLETYEDAIASLRTPGEVGVCAAVYYGEVQPDVPHADSLGCSWARKDFFIPVVTDSSTRAKILRQRINAEIVFYKQMNAKEPYPYWFLKAIPTFLNEAPVLVMEQGIDLFNFYEMELDPEEKTRESEKQIPKQTAIQHVKEGVEMLRNLEYFHGDLKLENVIVVGGVCKLADFGTVFNAETWDEMHIFNRIVILPGTPGYTPPRVTRGSVDEQKKTRPHWLQR